MLRVFCLLFCKKTNNRLKNPVFRYFCKKNLCFIDKYVLTDTLMYCIILIYVLCERSVVMRVCLAQYDIAWEDKKRNMSRCRAFLEEAAEHGAEFIVFPELSLTGFSMNTALAEEREGDTCRFFCGLSAEYGIASVFGYAERDGDVFHNRLAVSDEHGRVVADYAKMHPFSYGGEIYSSGNKPVSFSLGGMDFGLTICYDLRFPELYQQLSRDCGAVIVSANWGAARREHWRTLLRARAIENQCYILGCNRIGDGGGMSSSGDSSVFAPDGSEIAYATCETCLLVADIDNESVHRLRSEFPLKNDRKLEIYRNFYE